MSRTQAAAGSRPSGVSRALARDRLGVPAVPSFVLASVAPLTVAAGVIPTAYQTTGLTGIPLPAPRLRRPRPADRPARRPADVPHVARTLPRAAALRRQR
jgi:hypothetical protein